MIATAMAAFGLYAFLLAPKEIKRNEARFRYLFDRAQYLGKTVWVTSRHSMGSFAAASFTSYIPPARRSQRSPLKLSFIGEAEAHA
jgi:hypothetical protein